MSDETVDFSSVEAAIAEKRSYSIRLGTQLDRAFFEWCQKPEFGLVEIMALFPKTQDLKSKHRFDCEFACPECSDWRWENLGRGKIQALISHLKHGRKFPFNLVCAACEARMAHERASIDPEASLRAALRKIAETGKL